MSKRWLLLFLEKPTDDDLFPSCVLVDNSWTLFRLLISKKSWLRKNKICAIKKISGLYKQHLCVLGYCLIVKSLVHRPVVDSVLFFHYVSSSKGTGVCHVGPKGGGSM
jgi:isoleucyl-tRNA synthetase